MERIDSPVKVNDFVNFSVHSHCTLYESAQVGVVAEKRKKGKKLHCALPECLSKHYSSFITLLSVLENSHPRFGHCKKIWFLDHSVDTLSANYKARAHA